MQRGLGGVTLRRNRPVKPVRMRCAAFEHEERRCRADWTLAQTAPRDSPHQQQQQPCRAPVIARVAEATSSHAHTRSELLRSNAPEDDLESAHG